MKDFFLQEKERKHLPYSEDYYIIELRRCGGIGRRAGLKILWTNHPYRFDPDHRHHHQPNSNRVGLVFFYVKSEDKQPSPSL